MKENEKALIGDKDFIVVQNGEIVCSMRGKYELSVRAKLPAHQDLFKFGDKVRVIVCKKED